MENICSNCKTNITPVWRRYTLTVEEAAGYYHIGENKLRSLIDEHPHENFYVMNGNRVLIKRAKFEEYKEIHKMVKILFVCHGRISPNLEKSLCL